ncbi:hypothetical protein LKD72_12870 [Fusicatenibacter sp. CLA-AA-H213]|nr:hypothetical protein [Fusicatenibacter sp. CLA-AA-H213]
MRAKTRTITMSNKKADALKAEVERRMKTGETFSLSEIRMIMKSTGLSYAQVISRTKSLKRDMEKEQEKQGADFNKEEFISQAMDNAGNLRSE